MEQIPNIQQGMTQGQVFEIINKLIDAFNETDGAIVESLTNGKIDYNKLVNRPTINGVTLEEGIRQADLDIDVGADAVNRIMAMESRVAGTETAETQQLEKITSLEAFKTTYKSYVDTLRSQRASDRSDIDTLQTQRTTDSGRIDLLDQRYSAIHTTQTSEQQKVATLQTEIVTKAKQNDFSQVTQRLISAINRLNIVANAVILLENNGCTFGRKTIHDATEGQCISDVSNSFDFDN